MFNIFYLFSGFAPALNYLPLHGNLNQNLNNNSWDPLNDDGILWAVPKKRRSRERRTKKLWGRQKEQWFPIALQTCTGCGRPKEPRRLCR